MLKDYDQDNNGQLDAKEWELVTSAAKKAALKRQRDGAAQPPEHQIGQPTDSGLPFLIGSDEQGALSKKYRLKAMFCCVAFLAVGSAATWYISARGI